MSEENYSLQKAGSYLDSLTLKKRLKMLQLLLEEFDCDQIKSILDVGVTADKAALSSNYLEKYFTDQSKIIALSNQNASFLEKIYPGIKFQYGDARQLPFKSESIDLIFSSAVIEHIGSRQQQKKMISECIRVARKGVFITTPNRWFPIEVHTLLPFIHWLPKSIHRVILKFTGLGFYANEDNLNLLEAKTLLKICKELQISPFHFYLKPIYTLGLVSNLILIIKKGI